MQRSALRVRTPASEVTLDGERPCVVGRARSADIVIADERVSRRHLSIEPTADGWHVRDTSANGLWQNGRRVGDVDVRGEVVLRLGAVDGPEVVLTPQSTMVAPGAPHVVARPAAPTRPSDPPGQVPPGSQTPPRPASPPGSAQPARAAAPPSAHPMRGPATPPPTSYPVRPGTADASRIQTALPGSGAPHPDAATAAVPIAHSPRRSHPLHPGRIRLGRSRDNEITVADLLSSRHHAELLVTPTGVEVVDLGSANGTFLNGQRIVRERVAQRDVIAIGHHLFQLEGTTLSEYVDSGDVAFEVQGVSVFAGQKQLMHDMTFRLPGRSLLGVVGPSGAGKSTLLNALTGFRPADAGTVRYAGRDLYAEYDELRRRIGYVPQADPLHDQLTVKEALEYGAELRFPAETTGGERRARVEEVIRQLGLTQHADTPVGRLSGGQKKRTSVALELLTRPSLLFLDEPTSGLDPANDQSVMETLSGLAKGGGAGSSDEQGRTVIVVTHSVLFLDLCDFILVLAPGGHVAYFGPSDGALAFFGKTDFKEFAAVFRELEATPGQVMADRFRASEYFVPSAVVAPVLRKPPTELPSVRQQPVVSQLATLTRRYARVVLADRSYLRLIIAFPFLLGLIPRVIPADSMNAIEGQPNQDAPKVLVVLILCACFMGMANSVREIVKERAIYRRERTIGLSRTAYLGSKVIVLTVVTTLQCVVFTLIGLVGRTPAEAVVLGSPLVECLAAVIVSALASMMIGLLVSTLVDNADKTMPILVLVTMAQLVLSGGLIPMVGQAVLEQLSWLAPARWGFAALASTDDLNEVSKLGSGIPGTGDPDGLWEHSVGIWALDVFVVCLLGALALAGAAVMLRRIEPKVNRPVAMPAQVGAPAGAGPHRGPTRPAGPSGPAGPGPAGGFGRPAR